MNRDSAREKLSDLLQKQQTGTLSAREQQLLNNWLDELNRHDAPDNSNTVHEPLSAYEKADIKSKLMSGIDHAEPETISIHRNNTWKWLTAAASLAILCVTSLWLYNSSHSSFVIRNSSLSKSPVITVSGKNYLTLPDGTSVTMNANAELSYDFTNNIRSITLKGEAFFDVAHDKTKPFVIHTGEVMTTVLGTAFNINASTDNIIVSVTRGKVAVGNADQVYEYLLPNESIEINPVTYAYEKHTVNAEDAIAWTNQYLVFDEVTFEQAVGLIEKKFNVEIVIRNSSIKNCKVSGWFLNNESLDDVLTTVTGLRDASYKRNGKNIIIQDGEPCTND